MKSNTTSSTNSPTVGKSVVSRVTELSTFEKARLAGFSLLVLAVTGFAAVVLGELFSLLVLGWTADVGAELGIHRLHVMVIATVILTTLAGVFAQVYRPTRQVASMLGAFSSVVLAALIQLVAEGTVESILPFLVMVGLATRLHPAGRQLLQREHSYRPALLTLVVVAAIPMLAFTIAQVGLQINTSDAHAAAGHYTGMAQVGLLPLTYAFFAGVGMRGWRVAAWIAALPVAYYGLLSISFTTQAGSTGVLWGTGAILWAVAFVAVTEYSRIGTSPTSRRSPTNQD